MDLSLEIRNDVASFQLEGMKNAGATWLMDTGSRRRRIAILAPCHRGTDTAAPVAALLCVQTLAPYGNIIYAGPASLTQNIDMLLAARPAVLIMGDISGIPADTGQKLPMAARCYALPAPGLPPRRKRIPSRGSGCGAGNAPLAER